MMPWETEYYCGKAIWSVSTLLFGLFQVARCADHRVENLFTYCLANILLFTVVDGISHKSPHKYTMYHARFGLPVRFYCLSVFVKQLGPWICCVFCFPRQQQSSQCLQGFDEPSSCFFVLHKARYLKFASFYPVVVGRAGPSKCGAQCRA